VKREEEKMAERAMGKESRGKERVGGRGRGQVEGERRIRTRCGSFGRGAAVNQRVEGGQRKPIRRGSRGAGRGWNSAEQESEGGALACVLRWRGGGGGNQLGTVMKGGSGVQQERGSAEWARMIRKKVGKGDERSWGSRVSSSVMCREVGRGRGEDSEEGVERKRAGGGDGKKRSKGADNGEGIKGVAARGGSQIKRDAGRRI